MKCGVKMLSIFISHQNPKNEKKMIFEISTLYIRYCVNPSWFKISFTEIKHFNMIV